MRKRTPWMSAQPFHWNGSLFTPAPWNCTLKQFIQSHHFLPLWIHFWIESMDQKHVQRWNSKLHIFLFDLWLVQDDSQMNSDLLKSNTLFLKNAKYYQYFPQNVNEFFIEIFCLITNKVMQCLVPDECLKWLFFCHSDGCPSFNQSSHQWFKLCSDFSRTHFVMLFTLVVRI